MGKLDDVELAPDRVDQRNLVVLLLDTSRSMQENNAIDQLNLALRDFLEQELPEHQVLRRSGEIAIGGFSKDSVRWLRLAPEDGEGSHPFYFVRNLTPQSEFKADGNTPMAKALVEALNVIEKRKRQLRLANKSHEHRPIVYLVSDGRPNEKGWQEKLANAKEDLREAERRGKILFFSLGTRGADMATLASLSIGGADNAYDLQDQELSRLLRWVSRSSEVALSADDTSESMGLDDEALADPRDARRVYRSLRTKYEKRFFDELGKTGLGVRNAVGD